MEIRRLLAEKVVFFQELLSTSKKSNDDLSHEMGVTHLPKKTTDKPTILVVEDDPASRLACHRSLTMINCRCLTAANAEQAWLLYPSAHFIFMDVGLPDVDGLKLCHRIRQQPQGEDIPIVALTSHEERDVKEACYAAGMDFFITKPASLLDLYRALYYWLPEYRLVMQRVESNHE